MTETITRAPARAARQDWRRHVLALVLFAVLAWYTVVIPSYAPAPLLRAADDDSPDAEERWAETLPARGFAMLSAAGSALRVEQSEADGGVDELDWPEIIGGE